ncbi:MAG TPA: hypothetical protein VNK44_02105 [Candidatus Nitrosotenuis sp.]|nr:hypothetical protein [Candidatus Nitrosotenuis sp.]
MQITKQTRLDVSRIILLNRKIRPSTTSFKILSSFFDGLETKQIIANFSNIIHSKQPRKDACRYMMHLQSIGLLEKNLGADYSITKRGRWYVIAAKLEIPLFSLIMLASVYVFQKRMKMDNRADFYVVGFFFEKIKNLMTHPYRVHGALIRKNYVTKYANQTIRIPDDVFERLSEFDADFEDIVSWYRKIDDQITATLIKDELLFEGKITSVFDSANKYKKQKLES